MTATPPAVGFVGLGNMGRALASNLVEHGLSVIGHDSSPAADVPDGVRAVPSVAEVARKTEIVVLSLPDGDACKLVAGDIVEEKDRSVTHVLDTSTIGLAGSARLQETLNAAGIGYIDAPVSGGVAGARNRTLAVMVAGSDNDCRHVEPVLAGLSDRRFRVGDRPGLAQAMKLVNNFLSATALVSTSEAIAFGESAGLEMTTMLEVLNSSSGRNGATLDKFPQHVAPGSYDSGFANGLMAKDVALYRRGVADVGRADLLGSAVEAVWAGFAAAEDHVDFTRVFPFIRDERR